MIITEDLYGITDLSNGLAILLLQMARRRTGFKIWLKLSQKTAEGKAGGHNFDFSGHVYPPKCPHSLQVKLDIPEVKSKHYWWFHHIIMQPRGKKSDQRKGEQDTLDQTAS